MPAAIRVTERFDRPYGASPLSRRRRSTPAEMAEFRGAIWDIVAANQPCTPRQVYYRAVVAELIEKDGGKSRKNEQRVQAALDWMRERYVDLDWDNQHVRNGAGVFLMTAAELALYPGPPPAELTAEFTEALNRRVYQATRARQVLPFRWVADSSRTRYQATQYDDKDEMLREVARLYRRDLWREQSRHVEIWCESESICSVIMDTADGYGLAVLPCRGQSGKRFVWDSAQAYARIGKSVTCLYVGDFDPAGLDIESSVRKRLRRYGASEFELRRIAVTPEQVAGMGLTGHGLNPKYSQKQKDRFLAVCDDYGIPHEAVEAEAIRPRLLRELLATEIEALIDMDAWEQEREIEAEEARVLQSWFGGDDDGR
jgi:hypothetical protein